jgi:hypothetical protein
VSRPSAPTTGTAPPGGVSARAGPRR